jgi:hypothetical protein
LPDDDPKAMAILCGVLHHADFEPILSVSALLGFAVVTDKYDALRACRLAGKAWLDLICLQPTEFAIDCRVKVLAVAYLFDDHQNFGKISELLLAPADGVDHVRSYVSDAITLPTSVIGMCFCLT